MTAVRINCLLLVFCCTSFCLISCRSTRDSDSKSVAVHQDSAERIFSDKESKTIWEIFIKHAVTGDELFVAVGVSGTDNSKRRAKVQCEKTKCTISDRTKKESDLSESEANFFRPKIEIGKNLKISCKLLSIIGVPDTHSCTEIF